MTPDLWIGASFAVAMTVYLLFALARAEDA